MVNKPLMDLFARPDDGVGFRQGTVTAWNSSTGENTILVAGGTLSNVPILNTGEAIALQAGHTVGLLTFNGSWFILGRITVPGDADFASASVAFGGAGVSATNFSISTSLVTKASTTIAVPSWVDEAIVLATANVTIANSTDANGHYMLALARIDAVNGGGCQFGIGPQGGAGGSANDLNSGACSAQRLITNPGSTITLDVQVSVNSGAALNADVNNQVNLDAIAIFRSTT